MNEKNKLKIEETICISCIIVMLVVLTLQVALRYLFKNSNAWSDELSRYLFVWLIFIGASYAVTENAHIRIESAILIFPQKIRKHVKYIGNGFLLIFSILMFYHTLKYTIDLYYGNQMSIGLNIKMAYAYAALPVGFLLISIRIVQYKFLKKIYIKRKR